jgi:hypothetical protein
MIHGKQKKASWQDLRKIPALLSMNSIILACSSHSHIKETLWLRDITRDFKSKRG